MTSPKSSPTPENASVPIPATAAADSVKAVDAATAPENAQQGAETPPGTGFSFKGVAFPLALTVLAIFPLALGIGAVRLKAAASANSIQLESAEVEDEEEPVPTSRPNDREMGDRQFFERRYDVALECYQTAARAESGQLSAMLNYRIGLCQEGLGLWNEALECFSGVAASSENPVLKAAAVFGQVRLYLQMSIPDKAANLLQALELQQGADRLLPRKPGSRDRFSVSDRFDIRSRFSRSTDGLKKARTAW